MNEQVLVIDDEKDAVDGILESLSIAGITCRGETDPKRAIDSFRSNPTDVVIVDYVFPPSTGVHGIDIIAELQGIKPFTQFILMSAYINKDLDEESLTNELRNKIRAHRYIPKPIDPQKLVSTVREALETTEAESTDWKNIAKRYVNRGSVTAEEVRQLNEKIKNHLIKAVDRDDTENT